MAKKIVHGKDGRRTERTATSKEMLALEKIQADILPDEISPSIDDRLQSFEVRLKALEGALDGR